MKRWILILLLLVFVAPVIAQGETGPVITNENADQVTELLRLGRGTVNSAVYSPDSQTISVVGSLGIWLYNASDPAGRTTPAWRGI